MTIEINDRITACKGRRRSFQQFPITDVDLRRIQGVIQMGICSGVQVLLFKESGDEMGIQGRTLQWWINRTKPRKKGIEYSI
jgi:hypothetical protein